MGILDTVPARPRIYWIGLVVIGISFIVFFASIWYSFTPFYSSYVDGANLSDNEILRNLTGSVPTLVGSIVFIVIGTHMVLSGRKKSN